MDCLFSAYTYLEDVQDRIIFLAPYIYLFQSPADRVIRSLQPVPPIRIIPNTKRLVIFPCLWKLLPKQWGNSNILNIKSHRSPANLYNSVSQEFTVPRYLICNHRSNLLPYMEETLTFACKSKNVSRQDCRTGIYFCPLSQQSCGRGILDYPSSIIV